MTRCYRNPLVAILLSLSAHAEDGKPSSAPLAIRSFVLDPTHAVAALYLQDAKGEMVKLNVASMELGQVQQTVPVNGSLVLFNTATVDWKNPESAVAASVAVPQTMRRAIVIIMPAPANSKPACRMVLIDDSLEAFAKGSSVILSLAPLETAIEVGEYKLPCKPGAFTKVAAVKKIDHYNMAQTNFYYRKNGAWIVFSECKMKYLDVFRQLFIVYMRPGGTAPSLTTLIDQVPQPLPAK